MNQIKENEIMVWTVAVGNLPALPKFLMPKSVNDAVELIKSRKV